MIVMKRLIPVILLALILTACGTPQAVGELPTAVVLPSLTPTLSPTVTLTNTPTPTAEPSLTATVTPSPTETLTPTISVTPSTTITDTPTSTPTITPSPSPSIGALGVLARLAANATPIPQTYLPPVTAATQPAVGVVATVPGAPVTCSTPPTGGFGNAYANDPTLNTSLGCAQGTPTQLNSAVQLFERGSMVWLQGPIYVLYNDGRFQRYDDTYVAGVDLETGGEVPPAGLVEPVRGFGKIWRTTPDVRNGLGWGMTPENGNQASQQRFDRGWMIYLPQRGDIVVLVEDAGGLTGTWRPIPGTA